MERKQTALTEGDLHSFGALLKAFRTRRRLTQQQLAEAVGVHRSAIVRWEQGDFLPQSKALVLEVIKHVHLDEQESRHLLEASLTALSPYWHVPLPRNPFFTGREEVLETLHAQLGVEQAVALTHSSALHGLGGIGKTQIALEYAYRHALEYSAVFWISAESVEHLLASFMTIAELLQLPERQEADQQRFVKAVQRWLATHSGWLLIWDNLEDLDLLHRFLPPSRQGASLLTTRCQALGTLAQGMELPPLEQSEAMLFLLRRAKLLRLEESLEQVCQFAQRLPAEYTAAEELLRIMDRLPLALDQAGAYIEESGCGFLGYLRRYEQRQPLLLDRRGVLGGDHPLSVATTFRLASERVEQEPSAADLLRVCAFLHAEAIPEELFLEGAAHLGQTLAQLAIDPCQLDQAIAALRSLSLVQRQPETRTLCLHRLVQAVVRDRMSEDEHMVWMKRVGAALAAIFPRVSHQVWSQCERLLPHVLIMAMALPDQAGTSELAQVFRKAADYLRDRAQYEQAEPLYLRALRILESAQGPECSELAHALNNLAILYFVRGQYEQAEPLYLRALHLQEQLLGTEHPEVARPLINLALICKAQGKYEQAEPLYLRALHIREKALGPVHPDLARSLYNLASLYSEQGRYEQAEPLYLRALRLQEQAFGPEHPDLVYPLHGLALLYGEQGRYEQAEPLYLRAQRLREQALGMEHPLVAHLLHDLATLYLRQGRYEQAEPLYLRALYILESALGPEHHEVAASLNGLASLYREQNKYGEAEALFQRALSMREQHLGQFHPDTAQTLHDLALLWRKQGRLAEALPLAEHALTIHSQALGDAHNKTAATRKLYAQLLQESACVQEVAAVTLHSEGMAGLGGEDSDAEATSLPLHAVDHPFSSKQDPFQEFLTACCEWHPSAWCRSADLWQVYVQWAEEHQERFSLSRGMFIRQLKAHGCRADRTKTTRIWRGIALVSKNDDGW